MKCKFLKAIGHMALLTKTLKHFSWCEMDRGRGLKFYL
jgi:hypothetical protein